MKDTFVGKGVLKEFEDSVAAEKAAAEKAAAEKSAQAATAMATAPAAPAAAPAPKAEEPKPAAVPAEPTAPATAAQSAAWRRKLKGKIDGEEREWEVAEDDFDETKNPEGYKKLVERFQKSEDYDRPGGALDKKAAKIAAERHAAYMVERGFWTRLEDGTYGPSPAVEAYQRWLAAQRQPQPAAAQPAPAQPKTAEPTARQKRITELQAKYDGAGVSAAEMREYQELVTDERYDTREAERETRSRAEAARTAAMSAEEQARADRATQAQAHIDSIVESLKPQLRHPITGEVDAIDVSNLKLHMSAVLIDTRDWVKAEQSVRNFAARTQARLKDVVDRIPKQATAPPPAPVHRGTEGGQNGKPEESDDFDPRKPFSKQTGKLGAWEKETAGQRG
jgi:hypothetical protein